MKRLAVLALALLSVTPAAASSGPTALVVTIWPDERRSETVRHTLGCRPARGTLPRAATACTRLAAGGAGLFRPPPEDTACIEIYGGPQRAIVSGTVDGRRVWVSLRRRDGCEIARWNKLSFLLPISVAGPS